MSSLYWIRALLSILWQVITSTNAELLLKIEPWKTNFSQILIKIPIFSFKKIHLEMPSAKRSPFVHAWWYHQMETFSALLALCVRGIPRSPVNSPHKGQWHRALMFSLISAFTNGWVNNWDAGDLRRHHAHYDVTVMASMCSLAACISCKYQCSWYQVIHASSCWPKLCTIIPLSLVYYRDHISHTHTYIYIILLCRLKNLHTSSPGLTSAAYIYFRTLLTYLPLVPHICISKLGQHWLR